MPDGSAPLQREPRGERYLPSFVSEADADALAGARLGARVGLGAFPALVVVDMTRGFVEPGFLAASREAEPAVLATAELVAYARGAGVPLFFTRGEPVPPLTAGRWRDKKGLAPGAADPMNCDAAHEIVPLLSPLPGEVVVTKHKPSAFFGTDLASQLVMARVDTLIVTGLTTSGCVRATVVDAFSYNYRVAIPLECVADRSRISHEVTLFDLDSKYADVWPLQRLMAALQELGKAH